MMQPTTYQGRVLCVPGSYNLALLGGRGGGKTTSAELIALRHSEQFSEKARVLILRETLAGLREIEEQLDLLLNRVYTRVRSNRAEHVWRLPNGAIIECGYLADPIDYHRYQGRSFSLLIVDEAGGFRTLRYVDLLRSNLRVSGVPCRMVVVGNPGGRAHTLLHQRFIANRVPWMPYADEAGETWVWCPSTHRDNEHLPADYVGKLRASVGRDKELLKAWEDGRWDIARGAFFADCLDPAKQMLPVPPENSCAHNRHPALIAPLPRGSMLVAPGLQLPDRRAYTFLAADWGQTSPAVAFGCARLLAPVPPYPRGSLILIDEVHSADPDDWSVGLQWSPGRFADGMLTMCKRLRVRPQGCIDDARGLGSDETLIRFMQSEGLHFQKPAKGRLEGWGALRELLTNSFEENGKPGLWVSERCRGFWATMPGVPRDQLHPEDLDTSAIDHWADAARYAATHVPRLARSSHKPV